MRGNGITTVGVKSATPTRLYGWCDRQSSEEDRISGEREAFLRRRRWRIEDRWLKMKGTL